MFKQLTDEEKTEYREWVRLNYEPFGEIKGIWHPVVQQACVEINQELFNLLDEMSAASTETGPLRYLVEYAGAGFDGDGYWAEPVGEKDLAAELRRAKEEGATARVWVEVRRGGYPWIVTGRKK